MPSIWSYQSRRSCDSDNPWPVASTRIAFLDATGASIRGWPPAPSSLSEHWGETVENGEFLGPVPEERTKIPSLMEVALRACYNSPQLSQLPFMLPEDSEDCPNHLSQLLKKTWKIKEAGGQSCSVCKSNYIVPRTEWVEWWHCLPREGTQAGLRQVPTHDQGPIPLLRRGCSWQCWEESDNPLNRGWNSTIMPGRREEPNEAAPSEVARNIQQPLRQRR